MHRKQSAQAIVELALLLPVLILIALGMLDLGRVFYFQEAATNAAREGARFGTSIGATDADEGAIAQHARDGAPLLQATGDFHVDVADATPDYVEVRTRYEFDLVTPFMQDALNTTGITVRGTSKMPNAMALPD